MEDVRSGTKLQEEKIFCPGLPLAVYREIAAHLRQVLSLEVELLPQMSQHFDYSQSQVSALWVRHPADEGDREQVEAILGYYALKYGSWRRESL